MIRIGHISDSHFDERGRLQDVIDVHRAFVRQAAEAGVNLIVHSGDWFERRSTPIERLAVAQFLEDAAGVAPVFGVKGNHDADLDLSLFPRLINAFEGVTIMDRPTAVPGSAHITAAIDTDGYASGRRRLGLLALPWFDKANLVAQLEATTDQEETRQRTIDAALDLIVCLRAEATRLKNEGIIPILVGHVLVGGSEVSTGQTLIGTTVELSPDDLLDVGAAYAAIGHVHKTQAWFDGRVAYAGSPHRCNFGEPEAKGWRLVTLTDDGEFVSNEFIELPARSIKLFEHDATTPADLADMDASTIREGDLGDLHGALVRFRYRIRPEDLHLVDEHSLEKAFLDCGAAEVKLEAVLEQEMRARSPEIVDTQSVAEKLDMFFRAKGVEVDDAQRERLRDKLGLLEGGDHAAA